MVLNVKLRSPQTILKDETEDQPTDCSELRQIIVNIVGIQGSIVFFPSDSLETAGICGLQPYASHLNLGGMTNPGSVGLHHVTGPSYRYFMVM